MKCIQFNQFLVTFIFVFKKMSRFLILILFAIINLFASSKGLYNPKISSVNIQHDKKLWMDTNYIDDNDTILPNTFDAREQWPGCATLIGQVWDQGNCASGWAISATTVLTDRICIKSNQTLTLSPEDLLSCCNKCRWDCDGGWPIFAWEYLNSNGITTANCKSYSHSPCGHFNGSSLEPCNNTKSEDVLVCNKACDANSTETNYELFYADAGYRVYPTERQIKLEIMLNGPVQATFDILTDFYGYKNGVYVPNNETDYVEEQSFKLIGWGVDEFGQSYWLGVNSWNSDWGDNGLFKWIVNSTVSTVESQVYAALPLLNIE